MKNNTPFFDLPALVTTTLLVTGFIYIWNINKASAVFAGIVTLYVAPNLVTESTKSSAQSIANVVNKVAKQGK